jgi:transcriptional regulator with XRE-family HTH domain
MDIRALVGRNVAQLRQKRKVRQESFSELSGFTQSYLSQIENGRVNLTLLSLNDLAQALGVHPQQLLAEDGVEDKGSQPERE